MQIAATASVPPRNPGIVPPWLNPTPAIPIHPDPNTPVIFAAADAPIPITPDPDTPRIFAPQIPITPDPDTPRILEAMLVYSA